MSDAPKFGDWAKTLSLSELMDTRAIIDEKIAELQATIEAPMQRLKERAALVDTLMQAEMNRVGARVFTSPTGARIYWRRKMQPSVGDMVALSSCLADELKNGADPLVVFSSFQKRPTVEFVETWMEKHDGAAPPGINVFTSRELVFSAGKKTA